VLAQTTESHTKRIVGEAGETDQTAEEDALHGEVRTRLNVAAITRRRSGELVRGVFVLLLSHPEGLQAKSVLGKLADIVPPTEFEKTTLPAPP
jgi:hypothetical protein